MLFIENKNILMQFIEFIVLEHDVRISTLMLQPSFLKHVIMLVMSSS